MQLPASFAEPVLPPTIEAFFPVEGGLTIAHNSLKRWWPGTELNRRRQPFQGCALPPELPGHVLSHDAQSMLPCGTYEDFGGISGKDKQLVLQVLNSTDYINQLRFTQCAAADNTNQDCEILRSSLSS